MFRKKKKPHMHRWYATGVTPMHTEKYGVVIRTYSEVLYFCPDCNGNKTAQLDGLWTLQQIAGYDEFDPANVDPPVTLDMVEEAKQELKKWTAGP